MYTMKGARCYKVFTLKKVSAFVLFSVAVTYFGYKASRPVHYIFVNEHYRLPCNLPVLNPFDPSVLKFSWRPEPVKCLDVPSLVFVDEFNVLHVNESALSFFGLRSSSSVKCTAESVYRDGDDYSTGFNLPQTILKFPATLDADFTRVICWRSGKKVLFDNVVAGIRPRPYRDKAVVLEESEEQLSVVLFGLDSVSRSASIRHLPKTVEVLRELGSYDFQGLMKVGDNTIPNIMAMLTGLRLFTEETYGFEGNVMDQWPFLWKNFSEKNYVTMFGEDLPWLGMFNNGYKGFQNQPTDHYMRPFWLALGKEEKVTYHLSNVFKFFESKGLQLKVSELCNQNTMNHVELINYIKKFMLHYKDKRKFATTFLTELSHSFINFLHHGDEDFQDFLLWMKEQGFLDKTVVIVFSDHGSRFEDIRNTFVGRVESRMPMLHILLPEHIKRKYPDVDINLTKNTKRLLSHFDLYQTLIDILNKNYKNPSIQYYNGVKRGISIFQEVQSSRSCEDASIPADFCACYKSKPVNISENPAVLTIAYGIVDYVNNLVSNEPKCKRLKLNRILSAAEMSQGLKYFDTHHNGYSLYRFFRPEKNRKSFAVIVETVPGYATFDASCELSSNGELYSVNNVDRTNAYGNQSSCISVPRLKQYCYC